MQLFNEINSRKLGEFEYNSFSGFFNNFLFLFILFGTIGIQYLMVQYGGQSVRTWPLTLEQHGICIGIGATTLIWSLFVKLLLPTRWFSRLQMKEEPLTEEQALGSINAAFKKSFRESIRKHSTKVNIQ